MYAIRSYYATRVTVVDPLESNAAPSVQLSSEPASPLPGQTVVVTARIVDPEQDDVALQWNVVPSGAASIPEPGASYNFV